MKRKIKMRKLKPQLRKLKRNKESDIWGLFCFIMCEYLGIIKDGKWQLGDEDAKEFLS